MTNLGPEAYVLSSTFAHDLGEILSVIADQHPAPDDESAMKFVGPSAGGEMGVTSCSPRQYADAVLQGTEFGGHIVGFYSEISTNLGDPTGQRVIDDLRAKFLPSEAKK